MNKLFNQSRQNFEKFAQMAKNNNIDQSYSEKTLSKEEENFEKFFYSNFKVPKNFKMKL